MRKSKFLLTVFSAILFSSVSFAGVHSPPVNNKETKITKAIINFEMPAATVFAVVANLTDQTPVGENSPNLYAISTVKQNTFFAIAVEVVPLLAIQEKQVYNQHNKNTDYALIGYSMRSWQNI